MLVFAGAGVVVDVASRDVVVVVLLIVVGTGVVVVVASRDVVVVIVIVSVLSYRLSPPSAAA